MTFPTAVNIIEVGARDGLQNEKLIIPTKSKIDFIQLLANSGLRTIEATSFVSAKLIPQLADASEVLSKIDLNTVTSYPVLVPHEKAMQAAIKAGAKCIAVFTAVSETFSKKNTNCTIAESMENIQQIMQLAKLHRITVRGYISCTLGCPYEGEITYSKTAALAKRLDLLGCYQIALGDTIGIGTPFKAKQLIAAVAEKISIHKIAVHFHDTYGQALANIYAVLEQGITAIDSSVAGLGGCPYAEGAAGNVATEDVIYMLNGMGIATGVNLDKLLEASRFICAALGRQPMSKVAQLYIP